MKSLLRSACLLALALASGSAFALGLGQIRVKSAPGEPLLAEIPVISSDPAELQNLRASLASPETFTRVGLEPPIGVVAGLRFTPFIDANGRAVIRVTSSQPVTQPMLMFLVEVDWGQGRLVREYTALVTPPGSVASAPAAPVEAPVVEAPQVIERPRAPVAQTPTPAPAPQQAVRPPAAGPVRAAPSGGDAGPSPAGYAVRRGDTLSQIASRVAPEGVTANQTMVGLLRANPAAFIGGDANQLRSGTVLRIPAAGELQAIEAAEAAELVRGFARQWRQARSQPQAPVAQAAPAATARAPAPAADGRLEIVPPGGGKAKSAGTQSGIAAGGEGDMLRQELQQTKETLATRDAELQELKSRVAELEQLQKDQQTLIRMKDAELAAAQQRTGKAAEDAQAATTQSAGASALPWIALGVALLLALLAAAWARRRRAREPVFVAPERRAPSIADQFADADAVDEVQIAPVPADEPPVAPSWERGRPARATGPVADTGRPVAAPAWRADEAIAPPPDADAAVDDALVPRVDPSDAERLELAQAYIDLGDSSRARELLQQVADSTDATASSIARRMLQGLE